MSDTGMRGAIGGKCGCPSCKGENAGSALSPQPRNWWLSRKNKKGHGYHRTKPTGKRG
jgi:hypothetical protein